MQKRFTKKIYKKDLQKRFTKKPAKSIFMIHLAGFYKPPIIKILL